MRIHILLSYEITICQILYKKNTLVRSTIGKKPNFFIESCYIVGIL